LSTGDHADSRRRLELLNRLTIANTSTGVGIRTTHAWLRLLVGAARSRLLLIDVRARVNSALLTANILRLFTLDGA
jgi:hypothetical protein